MRREDAKENKIQNDHPWTKAFYRRALSAYYSTWYQDQESEQEQVKMFGTGENDVTENVQTGDGSVGEGEG